MADVHGNFAALQAVLNALRAQGVDRTVCLGDLVGYFHQSAAVLDMMMSSRISVIMGNHDACVLGKLQFSSDKDRLIGIEMTRRSVSKAHLKWLSGLPLSLEITDDGMHAICFHGSPWSPLDEYIYPDHSSFSRFELLNMDYVLLGHTHYPFSKRVGRCLVLNPGSCGQPRHGDHRACAAVLDMKKSTVDFLNVDYDIRAFLSEARENKVPEEVIRVLERSVR